MPVLVYRVERLLEALGLEMELSELLNYMEALKAEVSLLDDQRVEAEIEVDRPDLYLPEGFARAIKGFMGVEKGLPSYTFDHTGIEIVVEGVDSRPFIAGAVVWDVNVDEYFLEDLIQFQEKLHLSLGYHRKRFAIGLHDLDKLPSKKLCYCYRDLSARMTPLGSRRLMSIRDVLEKTEQGAKYGALSLRGGQHPALLSGEEIISLPPVINSETTRVEPGTRNIFIDVTGTDKAAVEKIATLVALTVAERSRTRRVGIVETRYGDKGSAYTPLDSPQIVEVDIERAEKWLGVRIGVNEAVELALRARFGAELNREKRMLKVVIPPYRVDIIDWVDVAEDLLLMKGLNTVQPVKPTLALRGRLLLENIWERKAREVLLGLGFTEVYSYTLTSCHEQEEVGGVPEDRLVKIANPSHVAYDCLRATLVPILLRVASINRTKKELRIFESGVTGIVENGSSEKETRVLERRRLGILIMGEKAGYEDIQAIVYSLIRTLGDKIVGVEKTSHRAFIQGRVAHITTSNGVTGVLGEIHPAILERYRIEYPVALAELDYTSIQPGGHALR